MLLTIDTTLVPARLTMVVKAIMMPPKITAFAGTSYVPVPSPTNWNPDQMDGSTNCHARATAAVETVKARVRLIPASQEVIGFAICLDQL